MAAVQQDTAYKRELIAGDLITIRSGIPEMSAPKEAPDEL